MINLGLGLTSTAVLGAGGGGSPPTEIFNANYVTNNGTTQYQGLSDTSLLNMGTDVVTIVSRFKWSGSDTTLAGKYNSTDNSNQDGYHNWVTSTELRFQIVDAAGVGSTYDFNRYVAPFAFVNGTEYTTVVSWDRLNASDKPKMYVNGVALTVSTSTSQITNPHLVNYVSTEAFRIGALRAGGGAGSLLYRQSPAISGICFGQTLSAQDAIDFHNGGQAQCWDVMPQALKDKFTAFWQLMSFTGHSEADAFVDKVSGLALIDNGSVPFSTAITIECN